jgi:hypothetical protein
MTNGETGMTEEGNSNHEEADLEILASSFFRH